MNTVSPILNRAEDVKPWYTHRWPWLLMLGPFLVVLAGLYTGWIAYTRQDALVVDDYYKQGKAINQDLRRDRVAAQMGLNVNLRYNPALGQLSGILDAAGTPRSGKLTLHLVHSTLPEKDIKLVLQADDKGAFSLPLPMLDVARWQVSLENEQRDWRLTGVWNWPLQQAIHIQAEPAPVK